MHIIRKHCCSSKKFFKQHCLNLNADLICSGHISKALGNIVMDSALEEAHRQAQQSAQQRYEAIAGLANALGANALGVTTPVTPQTHLPAANAAAPGQFTASQVPPSTQQGLAQGLAQGASCCSPSSSIYSQAQWACPSGANVQTNQYNSTSQCSAPLPPPNSPPPCSSQQWPQDHTWQQCTWQQTQDSQHWLQSQNCQQWRPTQNWSSGPNLHAWPQTQDRQQNWQRWPAPKPTFPGHNTVPPLMKSFPKRGTLPRHIPPPNNPPSQRLAQGSPTPTAPWRATAPAAPATPAPTSPAPSRAPTSPALTSPSTPEGTEVDANIINTQGMEPKAAADVPVAKSHQQPMIGQGQGNVTPHGYQDIPGNHRKKEKFRERKGGGSTGTKGPRHGERGGKNNPNTQWLSAMHFHKNTAERTGNWEAFWKWKQNNPKPVKH